MTHMMCVHMAVSDSWINIKPKLNLHITNTHINVADDHTKSTKERLLKSEINANG